MSSRKLTIKLHVGGTTLTRRIPGKHLKEVLDTIDPLVPMPSVHYKYAADDSIQQIAIPLSQPEVIYLVPQMDPYLADAVWTRNPSPGTRERSLRYVLAPCSD